MTKKTFTVMATLMTATLLAAACAKSEAETKPVATTTAAGETKVTGDATRGQYLVSILGCHDCHTPFKMGPNGPEPDMERALSGHPEQVGPLPAAKNLDPWGWAGSPTNTAFSGPWGISYTFNLTPDANTGLGIWTEDMFIEAIRTGKHMGKARPILPPMPWPVYRNATDDDLKAVFAYLRTLKPISNHVPDAAPADEPPAASN